MKKKFRANAGRYQAGPKGRNLEVVARRAPRLLVFNNCEFCFRILALSSHSVRRPSVDKRHMSIYANIYIDFEH